MGLMLLLASCASPPAAVVTDEEVYLDEAVSRLGVSLARQLATKLAPAGKTRFLAIDRMTDARSGQTTTLTQDLSQRIAKLLAASVPDAVVGMLDHENLGKADLLVAGTLMNDISEDPHQRRLRVSVSAVDLKTGVIVAQSSVWLKGDYDTTPDLFYRDSPIVPRDTVVDAQSATARALPGTQADPLYLNQLTTGAILNEAESAYNAGNPAEAARLFEIAVNREDGRTLRTYTGLYLANTRLDHKPESEEAFSGLVREGFASNQLSIRFLFKVNSTEFVEDPLHGPQYPMWLRQLARTFWNAKNCVEISGHSSRSGSTELNDKLSEYRAEAVMRYMMLTQPQIRSKVKWVGKGTRENIVGTGADDESDAVDRRVEFKAIPCP
jgi:outer membrane protein OmpA-like peptidoglycan-associated protein